MVNSVKLFFSCSLFFSLFFLQSKAGGIAGGEITYNCTSTPGIYQITFAVYSDCSSLQQAICTGTCNSSCTTTLFVQGADLTCYGVTYFSVNLNLTGVTDANQNPVCSGAKNTCTNMGCVTAGNFTPAIEKFTFTGTINLGATSGIPSTCCNVKIYNSGGTRNITSANTDTFQNFYTEALINRCALPCNSSPVYSNDLFKTVCVGKPVMFNVGAVDPDHDSLSYSFAPVLQSSGNPLNYLTPYTVSSPLPFYGSANDPFPLGFHCDPTTGDIGFTAQVFGASTMFYNLAVQISQWKVSGGVATFMGSTSRDFELWLMQYAADNFPVIKTSMQGSTSLSSNSSFNVFKGVPLCFDVIAKDTDFNPPTISDTTYIFSNHNLSMSQYGSTFTKNYTDSLRKINGPREDSYRFCWTPSQSHLNQMPFTFNITASDDRCPLSGVISKAISITVLDSPVFYIFNSPLNCYRWNLHYLCNVPSFVSTVQWQVSNTKGNFNNSNYTNYNLQSLYNYTFPDTGSFVLKMIVNGGTLNQRIIFDTVYQQYYPLSFSAVIPDTSVCMNHSINYKARMINGKKPYSFTWKLTVSSAVLSTSDTLTLPNDSSGNYSYNLTVNDTNNCSVSKTFYSNVLDIPVSILPASARICYGDSFYLNPGINNNGSVQSFLWNTGDTTQTITRKDSNLFIVTILNKNGCLIKDSFALYVNTKVNAKAYADTIFCGSQTISLHATGGNKYEWNNTTTKMLMAAKDTNNFVTYKFDSTSIAQVIVYKTQGGLECLAMDSVNIKVLIKPVKPVILGTDTILHGSTYAFSVLPTAGNSYNWNVTNAFIQNGQGSNQLIILFNKVGNCVLSVIQRSIDGCYSDTGFYYVFVKPGVGINETTQINDFRIFPNPSFGIFTVELISDSKNIDIEINDLLGRIIHRSQSENSSGIFKSIVDLNSHSKGIYFIKVTAGNSFKVNKITVE